MKVPRWKQWPHVLETQQFYPDTLEPMLAHMLAVCDALVEGRRDIPRLSAKKPRILKFYRDEPSTRTEDTFCTAGFYLGYHVRMIQGGFSSEMKGESLEDLVMALTQVGGMGYLRSADFFVIRHKRDGAAHKAVEVIEDSNADGYPRVPLPVINAGDGAGQHPTQALVDLATIYRERRWAQHPLNNLTIVMAGDTRYSRTINSLCHLLGRFGTLRQIRIIFSSHPELRPKEGLTDYLSEHGIVWEIEPDFPTAIRAADVVYMTRLQKERFPSPDLYEQVKGSYVFRGEYLHLLKSRAFITHPLPINATEKDAPPEIDLVLAPLARRNDPRCAWGRESIGSIAYRYALLDIIDAGLQEEENKLR